MSTCSNRRSGGRSIGTIAAAAGLSAAAAGLALLPCAAAAAGPVSVAAPKVPGFADVIAAVSPAVVSVRVQSVASPGRPAPARSQGAPSRNSVEQLFDRLRGADGDVRPVAQGSGFVISEEGYVVTNDDVVAGGTTFEVVLDDGTDLDAKLVGEDARTDLAVLKILKPDRKLTYVAFADADTVRVGDWIVAVGNPFGLGGTVSAGIVSARGRDVGAAPYDDFIQFDAPVNRGDAGGPVFDLSGRVVGVNAALFSPVRGTMGVAYAIPASTAGKVVNELIENGSVDRGWLGVALQPVTPDIAASVGLDRAHGALVADIDPKAPARDAGLEPGEVIVSVDGKPVADPRDLALAIGARHPGDTVRLGVWRDGAASTVTVSLAATPGAKAGPSPAPDAAAGDFAGSPLGKFGLVVVASESGQGAVITDIAPDSVADRRGLGAGDVILSVDGRAVTSAHDIVAAISSAIGKGRKAVLIRLENGNRSRFVALPVDMG